MQGVVASPQIEAMVAAQGVIESPQIEEIKTATNKGKQSMVGEREPAYHPLNLRM